MNQLTNLWLWYKKHCSPYHMWLLLAFFVLGCGLWGVWRGSIVSFDFMNYHLYNAYSFMEGRFYRDLLPAGIHTFLNPLGDVPFYLLIKYLNDYPRWVCFIQSAISGFLLFFFYKFCGLFFSKKQGYWVWFIILLAVWGYMFRSQIGAPNNDVLINVMAAVAVYGLFRFIFYKPSQPIYVLGVGLLVGLGTGIKYTMAPVALALFAVLCVNGHYIKHPWRKICLFIIAAAIGFLITNGYFMWRLWVTYDSPVFPFYNQIFKSPFFAPESLRDMTFYPHTALQWIFFPFLRFMEHEGIVSEVLFDARLTVGYISFFVIGIFTWWLNRKKSLNRQTLLERRKTCSLLIWFGVMYVAWLSFFGGILRYVIILEMSSCLLAVYCVKILPVKKIVKICLSVGLVILFACSTYMGNWGEVGLPFKKKVIDFTPAAPQVEKNALVIFWGSPMSFLAMFLPPDATFIGGMKYPTYSNEHWTLRKQASLLHLLPGIYLHHRLDEQIKEKIANHAGPIYLISIYWQLMLDPATLAPYGVEKTDEPCFYFNSNMNISAFYRAGWALCKLKKIKPAQSGATWQLPPEQP